MELVELGEITLRALNKPTIVTTYEDYQQLVDNQKWLKELSWQIGIKSDYDEKTKKYTITASAYEVKKIIQDWYEQTK